VSLAEITLTCEQVEQVVRYELRDCLRHPEDLEPALQSALVIVLGYYDIPDVALGLEESPYDVPEEV